MFIASVTWKCVVGWIGGCDASDGRRRVQTGAICLCRGSIRTFYKVVAGQQRLEDRGHYFLQELERIEHKNRLVSPYVP